MSKLIEYDHLSIDGKQAGDAWWAGQQDIVPGEMHFTYQLGLLSSAVGIVLGRETYEGFAQTWPTLTGDVADRINPLPKYVATRSLTDFSWNAQPLEGDAVEAVARLKDAGDGTLIKYGNGAFSRALFEAGLIDELHLSVSPFVAGAGESLFSGLVTTRLELTNVTEVGNGTVVLAYVPKR
ncbi:dihydrofolate reductase [Diaminobutyricimonas aerilata]|uniref:Dihydrofolate reductase n=1 Tax=Diaminobutyricimonas aerilata TaxID=1162967 RepID=A0A2M9CIK6_9MICO|nr:dihydrofolate reductase family protein [Diaminobutyricimonas aerilata]PJJ71699.1 dihydrofolate reductase [Diaminobutyricimonas aerilata]